jgi:hypothetical protein
MNEQTNLDNIIQKTPIENKGGPIYPENNFTQLPTQSSQEHWKKVQEFMERENKKLLTKDSSTTFDNAGSNPVSGASGASPSKGSPAFNKSFTLNQIKAKRKKRRTSSKSRKINRKH